MTHHAKLLAISAFAALSMGFAGCSDDSGSPTKSDPKPDPVVPVKSECTADACAGDYILNRCNNGKIEKVDCSLNDQICSGNACTDKPLEPVVPGETCTADACLDDKILSKCVDGEPVKQDCSKSGKICSNDACVKPPQCTANQCLNTLTLAKCVEGQYTIVSCADTDQECINAECADKPVEPVKCDSTAEAKCDGTILVSCTPDGTEERIDCTKEKKICDDEAHECVAPPPEKCKPAQNSCDGNTAVVCNEESGEMERTDCTTQDKLCKSTLSEDETPVVSCEWECDEETYETSCVNSITRKICKDHHVTNAVCEGRNTSCKAGECVVKSPQDICLGLGMEWVEETQECIVSSTPSVVGETCSCLKNCEITITGAEIKSIIGSTVRSLAGDLINQIKDDDKILIPNYFPGKENIEGCDGLAAVVPEGMTLGCFRDSKITFPKNLTNLIRNLPTTKLSILGGIVKVDLSTYIDAAAAEKINGIADLLDNGIQFTSPEGYCLAATIDIGGTISAKAADIPVLGSINLVESNPLDKKNGLVKKINTGDHATVVANAANVGNYCPSGSTLFSYSLSFDKPINQKTDMATLVATLKGDVGFDMCLKSCNFDEDCRKDYSCVELPDGVPAEGQTMDDMPKKRACFSKANIDYFTEMTNAFAPAEP